MRCQALGSAAECMAGCCLFAASRGRLNERIECEEVVRLLLSTAPPRPLPVTHITALLNLGGLVGVLESYELKEGWDMCGVTQTSQRVSCVVYIF